MELHTTTLTLDLHTSPLHATIHNPHTNQIFTQRIDQTYIKLIYVQWSIMAKIA